MVATIAHNRIALRRCRNGDRSCQFVVVSCRRRVHPARVVWGAHDANDKNNESRQAVTRARVATGMVYGATTRFVTHDTQRECADALGKWGLVTLRRTRLQEAAWRTMRAMIPIARLCGQDDGWRAGCVASG